jgi:AcrR family transcriptional regulator
MGMLPTSQVSMRADARRNYERLLNSAKVAFAETGTDVSLDDIARGAGVGNATLYRHFPTRDALLEAVLRELHEVMKTKAPVLLAEPDARAALDVWLTDFVDYSRTFRGLPDSVTASLNDPKSSLYASCREMLETAALLLRRAQSAGSVRMDIDATDLCAQAAGIAWACEKIGADGTREGRLLAMLSDGLRATG